MREEEREREREREMERVRERQYFFPKDFKICIPWRDVEMSLRFPGQRIALQRKRKRAGLKILKQVDPKN